MNVNYTSQIPNDFDRVLGTWDALVMASGRARQERRHQTQERG